MNEIIPVYLRSRLVLPIKPMRRKRMPPITHARNIGARFIRKFELFPFSRNCKRVDFIRVVGGGSSLVYLGR